MKAAPHKEVGTTQTPCKPEEATHLWLLYPNDDFVILPVIKGTRDRTGCWSWNGDTERPTIKPSVLRRWENQICHTWITDGKVQFLTDTTHELSGQTLDLKDIEDL